MKLLFQALIVLSLFLACVPSRPDMNKVEARGIMDDVSRWSLAYEPLTEHDDTMMQRVVAYYKKHGTSNEVMEAAVTNCCTRLFQKVQGGKCSTSAEAFEWLLEL